MRRAHTLTRSIEFICSALKDGMRFLYNILLQQINVYIPLHICAEKRFFAMRIDCGDLERIHETTKTITFKEIRCHSKLMRISKVMYAKALL